MRTNRRNFIHLLVGGLAAGPAVISSARATSCPAAFAAPYGRIATPCTLDIRQILTENMLREIRAEEDKVFFTAIDNTLEIEAHRAANPPLEGGTVIDDSLTAGRGFVESPPAGGYYRPERFKVTFNKIQTPCT